MFKDTRNAKTVKSVLTTSSEKAKKIHSWKFALPNVKIICFSDKTFHLVTLTVSQTSQPSLKTNLAFPFIDKTNKDFQPCIQQSS